MSAGNMFEDLGPIQETSSKNQPPLAFLFERRVFHRQHALQQVCTNLRIVVRYTRYDRQSRQIQRTDD